MIDILIVLYSLGIDIFRVSRQSSKKVKKLPFILMMLTLPMKKPAMIMELLNRPTFKSIRLKIRIDYYLNIPTIYTKNSGLANNHLCISQLNDFFLCNYHILTNSHYRVIHMYLNDFRRSL